MSNVVCKKCGATGHSKCPRTRNVFPDDQNVALLKHVLAVHVKNEKQIILDYDFPSNMPPDEAFDYLIHTLQALTQKQRKELMCQCEWIMKPGQTCTFGCCDGGSNTPDDHR